jgi:hypothetical protein
MDGEGSERMYGLEGWEALTPVFADLNGYEVTTNFFNGQSTVGLDGRRRHGRELHDCPPCLHQRLGDEPLRRLESRDAKRVG